MIPAKFLSKVGIHEVEIEGVKVKVSHITDNSALVLEQKINQLKGSLDKQRPVVGVDVKVTMSQNKQKERTNDLLILFGGSCCLLINLNQYFHSLDCLMNFMASKDICFVGFGLLDKVGSANLDFIVSSRTNSFITRHHTTLSLSNVVEVRDLAARVLKKPNLCKFGLSELYKEVRSNNADQAASASVKVYRTAGPSSPGSSRTGACPNWRAMVLSDEEIKYAMHEAYTCCVIADKMLGILDAVEV